VVEQEKLTTGLKGSSRKEDFWRKVIPERSPKKKKSPNSQKDQHREKRRDAGTQIERGKDGP